MPNATLYKPQQPYKSCIKETFKDFPPSSLALVQTLLSIDPDARGTATTALNSKVSSPQLDMLSLRAFTVTDEVFICRIWNALSFLWPNLDLLFFDQFFTTEPFACDPSSLPKSPPSKEMDLKLRDEAARRCLALFIRR